MFEPKGKEPSLEDIRLSEEFGRKGGMKIAEAAGRIIPKNLLLRGVDLDGLKQRLAGQPFSQDLVPTQRELLDIHLNSDFTAFRKAHLDEKGLIAPEVILNKNAMRKASGYFGVAYPLFLEDRELPGDNFAKCWYSLLNYCSARIEYDLRKSSTLVAH